MEEFNISNHAAQRYAERIMGKDDTMEASSFATLYREKIKNDINKLIQYGTLIYTGRQFQKDGRGNIMDVYVKDCWVVLVDQKISNVITLYKIDLGLGDEFNLTYVSKMVEKINAEKELLDATQKQVQEESDMYRGLISGSETQIKEYRSMIKNLEELCGGYKTIVDNNCVKVSQANRNVAEMVNTLIAKKEF